MPPLTPTTKQEAFYRVQVNFHSLPLGPYHNTFEGAMRYAQRLMANNKGDDIQTVEVVAVSKENRNV